jgi:hypothetical protein
VLCIHYNFIITCGTNLSLLGQIFGFLGHIMVFSNFIIESKQIFADLNFDLGAW